MGVAGRYSQCMEESLYTVNCSNGMADFLYMQY